MSKFAKVASAVVLTQPNEFVRFLPAFKRHLKQWKQTLDQNPDKDVRGLLLALAETKRSLELFESTYFKCENNAVLPDNSNHLLVQFEEKLGKLHKSCAEILDKSFQKQAKWFPSFASQRVNKIRQELDSTRTALQELIALMPTPRATQFSHSNRFCVVRNVGMNPPGVSLDFESVDEDGTPSTCEGKLKSAVLKIYVRDQNETHGAVVANGMVGVGKTCAIRAIARLFETECRFPGGILFMSFGAEAGLLHLIRTLADTVELAGGQDAADEIRNEGTISVAIHIAGEWFRHHDCLFIFDDIWCVHGITPDIISQLSEIRKHPQSLLAYTTRDEQLVGGKHVIFRTRAKLGNDSMRMLLSCAGGAPVPSAGPARIAFDTILNKCDGLPLQLSFAGSEVRRIMERGVTEIEQGAWQEFLDWSGFDSFIEQSEDYFGCDISQTILLSMDLIDELRQPRQSSARELFKRLCILQNQHAVPLTVITQLWDVEDEEAEEVVYLMERLSIVQLLSVAVDGCRERCVYLHEIVLEVARQMSYENWDASYWVKKLIKTYEVPAGFTLLRTSIASKLNFGENFFGPELLSISDNRFMAKNVCWFLYFSKLWNDLLLLALDPRWIAKQMSFLGDRQVTKDIGFAIESLQEGALSSDSAMKEKVLECLTGLEQAIRLSATIVKLSTWDGMLSFQLHGRMAWMTEQNKVAEYFVDDVKVSTRTRPMILPSVGFLDAAGTSLQHEIFASGRVLCVDSIGNDVVILHGKDDGRLSITSYNMVDGSEDTSEIECWRSGKKRSFRTSCATFLRNGDGLVIGTEEGSLWICCRKNTDLDEGLSMFSKVKSTASDSRTTTETDQSGRFLGSLKKTFGRGAVRIGKGLESSVRGGTHASRVDNNDREWKSEEMNGHKGAVTTVAVSRDWRRVASGSRDYTVRVWEEKDGTWQSVALVHEDEVSSVAITGHGKRIVAGLEDGSLHVWNEVGRGWESTMLQGRDNSCPALAVSEDGKRVVSVSRAGGILVWGEGDRGWDNVVLVGPKFTLCRVALMRDGKRIVFGLWDGTIQIWDERESGWEWVELGGHESSVVAVTGSTYLHRLVSGAGSGTVRVWEEGQGWKAMKNGGHEDKVTTVLVTEDKKRVVSASSDTIRIWDSGEGGWKSIALRCDEGFVDAVAITANGKRVVSASEGGTVIVWDDNEASWNPVLLGAREGWVSAVTLSEDGKWVKSESRNGTVRVWHEGKRGWEETDGLLGNPTWVSPDRQLQVGPSCASGQLGDNHIYGALLEGVHCMKLFETSDGFCATFNRPPYLAFAKVIPN